MQPMPVYRSLQIKQWEQRWFEQGNSSFGLMQQAAWAIAQKIFDKINHLNQSFPISQVIVWCGSGNNGGDGYLSAVYLQRLLMRIDVFILATKPPSTPDCQKAAAYAQAHKLKTIDNFDQNHINTVHIDAMFGNGLNQPLQDVDYRWVEQFNQTAGFKIAIDLPSGLHPDTGMPMPICTICDMTISIMGYKIGLFSGQAKSYVGQLVNQALIPPDDKLHPIATIRNSFPKLPKRHGAGSHQHKGNFGSVLVIGGHAMMGGAAILSGTSAIAVGAGRVTVMCHKNHHAALLSLSPNLMLADIDQFNIDQLSGMDTVCFGMGLGRDEWSKDRFEHIFNALIKTNAQKNIILDADALWHLSNKKVTLPNHWIATPHHAEAARLLNVTPNQVESDRLNALFELAGRYGGRWVLKGANSLSLESENVYICTLGNAGMATAGMGDVLSGMIAGIIAQNHNAPLSTIVALHAHCGDILAADSVSVDVIQMAKTAAKILASS